MLAGALALTFGAASTLQGWATARTSYANVSGPAATAPLAGMPEPATVGVQRARLHVAPRESSNTDQMAQSKL